MKILYIASSGKQGGASIALYNLIQGLCNTHDLYIVFPNKGAFSEDVEKLGVTCFYINTYSLSVYPSIHNTFDYVKFPFRFVKKILFNTFAIKKLTKICNKVKPDIIHTNVGPLNIGFKVARKLRIKHIWHIREYQDLDFGMRFFPSKKNFFKKLHYDNNYSIAITKDVFRYWNLRKNIDTIIYDGVVANESHTYISQKEKCFLFVGRVEEAKGVLLLLKVFAKFTQVNTEYSLLIAGRGNGEYYKRCLDFVKSNNLEDKVSFLGQRNDVYQLMERAKALIVPSRFEGFGFITTEAMYNHCLVIGKNTAGTKEQFDNGFIYKSSEIAFRFNTAEELLQLLHNTVDLQEEQYQEITKNAYETVMENYTIQKHIDTVKFFYNEIIY